MNSSDKNTDKKILRQLPHINNNGVEEVSYRSLQLSQIIHKIGHDIGNPLTSIISLSSILERFSAKESPKMIEPSKLNEYSSAIISEAWKISYLNEATVFLLSDKEIPTSPCIITELVEKSVKRMNSRHSELLSNVIISNSVENDLLATSDADRLGFVISELIRNASKALKEIKGEKLISIKGHSSEDSVFIRFENRCDKQVECKLGELLKPLVGFFTQGTGIGLSSVHHILGMLDATISLEELESTDGSISFVAELKLPASEMMQPRDLNFKTNDNKNDDLEYSASELSIVIVDDEQMVASAIQKILEMGFAPTPLSCKCVSGKEAISIIDSGQHFDAMLCDLNLSEMSGRHVYEHLLNEQPKLQTKFVFLTGDQGRRETLSYLESAGRPYIFKPFEPQDLINIVSNIVE